jgi:hypothetical protein
MWSLPVYVFAIALSIWAALHSWHDGQPRLNLRGTTITGKRLQTSNLDFFGGRYFLSLHDCFSNLNPLISGIPFAEPPVATFAFLLLARSILFLPCNHLMPVTTVPSAYNQ